MDEKVEKALVAVGDESALQDNSDDESSDEDEGGSQFLFSLFFVLVLTCVLAAKKLLRKSAKDKQNEHMDVEERGWFFALIGSLDSSGSDSDDPDKEFDSVVFLQV